MGPALPASSAESAAATLELLVGLVRAGGGPAAVEVVGKIEWDSPGLARWRGQKLHKGSVGARMVEGGIVAADRRQGAASGDVKLVRAGLIALGAALIGVRDAGVAVRTLKQRNLLGTMAQGLVQDEVAAARQYVCV